MSIAQEVYSRIDAIEAGKVIGYTYFNLPNDKSEALAAALTRFTQKGIIKRLSKGLYYKPKESEFGKLAPNEDQILKKYLYQGRKRIGYLTGINIYNRWGLTTQIANTNFIACAMPRRRVSIGRVKIDFVKAYTKISENDIEYLQFLDAVKDIKKIPDNDVNTVCRILLGKLRSMKKADRKRICELSFYYNPAARALAGAMLESIEKGNFIKKLKGTLNGLSQYKIGISEDLLPNKENWNIK